MPVDPASIAAAVATGKTLLSAFTKAGDNARAGQLIEIMSILNGVREENVTLKDRIKTLDDNSAIAGRLTFVKNAYWLDVQSDDATGPFCSACWDSQSKVIRLLHTPGAYQEQADETNRHQCPVCKTELETINPFEGTYPYKSIAKIST